MDKTAQGHDSYSDPDGQAPNLPHEKVEINLKTSILCFLKENVFYDDDEEKVREKQLDLTNGLYKIFLQHRESIKKTN